MNTSNEERTRTGYRPAKIIQNILPRLCTFVPSASYPWGWLGVLFFANPPSPFPKLSHPALPLFFLTFADLPLRAHPRVITAPGSRTASSARIDNGLAVLEMNSNRAEFKRPHPERAHARYTRASVCSVHACKRACTGFAGGEGKKFVALDFLSPRPPPAALAANNR